MEINPILSCVCDNAKTIYTLLYCLSDGKKNQSVICDIDSEGISFIVRSKAKSVQSKTTLPSTLFKEYTFEKNIINKKNNYSFGLSFHTLLDCLTIFGMTPSTSSVTFRYNTNATFNIILEENKVLTECILQTMDQEDSNDILNNNMFENAFENSIIISKILIKSECLRDAFIDLMDVPNSTSIHIKIKPKTDDSVHNENLQIDYCLRFSIEGEINIREIDFDPNSDAFYEFYTEQMCHAKYHLEILQLALKALGSATETYIRMNKRGMLSIQHLIETHNNQKCFIECLLCAEEIS